MLNRFARAPEKVDNQIISRETESRNGEENIASIPGEPKILDCCILGGGMSGLTAAGCMVQRGETNFCVIEARSQVAGTWFDHDYPGAGTDTEVQSYAPTFKPIRSVHQYATRDELLNYCIDLAGDIPQGQLYLNTQILSAEFASEDGLWTVKTNNGEFLSRVVINCAIGSISKNFVKDVGWPGRNKFEGQVVHSSHLTKDTTIFENKKVAIVGLGATTIQLAPSIMPRVSHLDVLHRTKPYILNCKRQKISHNGIAYTLNRWFYEIRNVFFTMFDSRPGYEWILRYPLRWLNYRREDTPLLPPRDQPIHCTRRAFDYNGFKSLVEKENFQLVDVSKSQISFVKSGLCIDSRRMEYDVIVLAVGYDIGMASFPIKVDNDTTELTLSALHGGLGMFKELPNFFWPFVATGFPLFAIPPRLVEDSMARIIPLIQHLLRDGYRTVRPSEFLVSTAEDARNKMMQDLTANSVILARGCNSYRYLNPVSFSYGSKPVYKRDSRFLQSSGPTRLLARVLAFIFLRPRFFDYSREVQTQCQADEKRALVG